MRGAILICALSAAPAAFAEDTLWQEAGQWVVRVNADKEMRCYASRTVDGGSEVQIGTEPALNGGFFAIYNPAWTHIDESTTAQVEFDFGVSKFRGSAEGRILNGIPGGYAFFNNPAFVQEFARRQTVTITGDGGAEFELDLTGTSLAVRAVLACQDAQPDPSEDK